MTLNRPTDFLKPLWFRSAIMARPARSHHSGKLSHELMKSTPLSFKVQGQMPENGPVPQSEEHPMQGSKLQAYT